MAAEYARLKLEPGETLVTLRQRLAGLRGQRVLLVWEAGDKRLRRKLDLTLIQREARRLAIQLAIVTSEAEQKHYAAELNISSFDSVDQSEKARWKRGRHKVFLPRYHRPSPDLGPEDLEFIARRLAGRGRRSVWRALIERAIVLALLLGIAGLAVYAVAPGAALELSLREDRVSAVVRIVADGGAGAVDLERGIIPAAAMRETVETTATIPTSGSAWLESVSAAGVVTFTNLTAARVDIAAGTVLGTSAGEPIFFETSADVVVPPGVGQRVNATVIAMEGYRGVIGNVDAGMINSVFGALSERVSVINLAPSAGGEHPRVRVVTAQDREALLERARLELQSLAFEAMRRRLGSHQIIVIESIGIEDAPKDWSDYSADVGVMTSELSLTMRAVVSALVVDERYARQIALSRLKNEMPANAELDLDSVVIRRGPFSWQGAKGQAHFALTASARAMANLDREALRQELAGLSIEDAVDLLARHESLSPSAPPRLSLFPDGLRRMPLLPLRIDLSIRESAA